MTSEAIQQWEINEGLRVVDEDDEREQARRWVREMEVSRGLFYCLILMSQQEAEQLPSSTRAASLSELEAIYTMGTTDRQVTRMERHLEKKRGT